MHQQLLDVKNIAILLRCSSSTVRRLIDRGQIKAERLTQTSPRRVHQQHLEQYAQQHGILLDWSLLAETQK